MSSELVSASPYESRLKLEPGWALREGSMHFEKGSAVHSALNKIVKDLDRLGVPYALAGGMALFIHGYRRFTEDVDLLVDADGLKTLHDRLEGRGYLPPFAGSKNLRETDTGVRIEFLVTGEYPGDGKPKPVAFPDPRDVAVERDGIRCLTVEKLVELKLASGTTPGRLKDLADVQELIRALGLSEGLAERLDPSVREKYRELWAAVQGSPPDQEHP